MIKKAFVFPGQGSQSVGMGKDLYENFKIAKEVFEEASDAINLDLKKLCFDGPKDELGHTHNTQPALLTVSEAAYKVLAQESGIRADFMAGHSLGEYSALVASETLSFTDAVKLVRYRGQVMAEAAGAGIGKMAAILGLAREGLDAILDEVRGDSVLAAANYNCPGQIIISGHVEAVRAAMDICKQRGAKRALRLDVSGPFHSELMSEAAGRLRDHLQGVEFKKPKCAVYSNVTAKPYGEPEEIAPLLVDQMKSSVMWEDTVNGMLENGAGIFIEVGPGKVLSGLIKRTKRDAVCGNVYDTESLKNTIETDKTVENS